MLFNKPLAEIEENDLQILVDNAVREGREVEYKATLNIYSEEQKQEFLNDVSSFANTTGGYLIYGIKESKEDEGKPTEVCGLKGENPGKNIGAMENIIRTGLDPQLYGVTILPVPLPSHEGRIAFVLHIPQSYALPHMVKSSGRFYARNSTGKFSLDVAQLRNAFGLAGTTAERIRSFRIERLSKIIAGEELPALLDEQAPKIVLHIIPFSAFNPSVFLNIKILNDHSKWDLTNPLVVWDIQPDTFIRFNLDGIVRTAQWIKDAAAPVPIPAGYVQVFRNGIVEVVDVTIFGINGDKKRFHGETFEKRLLQAVKRHIELQQFLGIEPPVFIMVSLLGMRGYKINHGGYSPICTEEIDRTDLIIPEVVIDTFDGGNDYITEVMRLVFDTIWNAANYASSPNYDNDGKYLKWWSNE